MPENGDQLLYRALNPVYAREPLSGRGAELYGGRFNPKGVAALYLSLSPVTALREVNQVGYLQPTTLVSYHADLKNLFDTRDPAALAEYGVSIEALSANTWRDEMRQFGEARTQSFARQLMADGYTGLLVRSFAPGTSADDLNIVLWKWGREPGRILVLIDDEQRLSRSPQ